MSTVYRCDFCRYESDAQSDLYRVRISGDYDYYFDACRNCRKQIINYLRNWKNS